MSEYAPLTTPVDSSRPPPFHEMNEHPKRFERMSAQLMDCEESLQSADLFGIDGQKQYGIDIWGERKNHDGIELGSCKCYQKINKGHLKKWSNEFLDHWETYWKSRNVRRFLLITAGTNITSPDRRDEIETERARFKRIGVNYEVWGPEILTRKLQFNRLVAVRFLSDVWADRLCGASPPEPSSGRLPAGTLNAFQVSQLTGLQVLLSGQAEQRVETAVQALRNGNYDNVKILISELRSETLWPQLQPSVQARVLRLEGALALEHDDLPAAKQLAAEADSLSSAEPRLLAHIALRENGVDSALATLGHPITYDGRQLRAALLIQGGDIDEAENLVMALAVEQPNDAETRRLEAFAELVRDCREQALIATERAEELAPAWKAVIRVGAVVRYACSLSPAVTSSWIFYPNPVDLDLVKEDDESRKRLEQSLERFERLLVGPNSDEDDKIWKLACLSNLPDRRSEGEVFCQALLEENPANVDAIGWALARAYNIDRFRSRAALSEIYVNGNANPNQVRAYAWLITEEDGPEVTAITLAAHAQLQQDDGRIEAEHWIARQTGDILQSSGEQEEWLPPRDLPDQLIQARTTGDWTRIEQLISQLLTSTKPRASGLQIAQTLAANGRWAALTPYIDGILAFKTGAAISLAAHIIYRSGTPEQVLEFIGQNKSAFAGNQLPPDLRRIEITAKAETGDVPEALRAAEVLAAQTQLSRDRLHRANLLLNVGDTAGALPVVRDALRSGSLKAQEALRYSAALAGDDIALAQDLWRHALKEGVHDQLVLAALTQGYHLGLDDETGVLIPRMHERALSGAGDVWILSTEETIEQIRGHRSLGENAAAQIELGAGPIHILSDIANINIAEIFNLEPKKHTLGPPNIMLIRHGARPIDIDVEITWQDWRLHMDITSLLLADQLDLLTIVERLPAPCVISRKVPIALQQLEQKSTHQQPSRLQGNRAILDAHAHNRLCVHNPRKGSDALTVRHEQESSNGHQSGPTLHSIATALRNSGAISVQTYTDCLNRISRSEGNTRYILSIGERLIFIDNTIETLAAAGLLDATLTNFICEIEEEDFHRITLDVDTAELGGRLADRLKRLRQRVAHGLETGRYTIAPSRPDNEEDDILPTTPLKSCLFDLISAPAASNGVIWIDDRYVSGFPNINSNIVVGIVEVLGALVKAALITEEERAAKLLKLREGGALFIPITVSEVMSPLVDASIWNQAIVETPALTILRRNFSTALSLDAKLKIGNDTHETLKGRPDETPFLLSCHRLAEDCLIAIWKDSQLSIEVCRARANWVWANLRMDQTIRGLPGEPGIADELLAALRLAGILSNQILINLQRGEKTIERRRAYLAWIEDVAIVPKMNEPEGRFFDLVADQLKTLWMKSWNSPEPADDSMIYKLMQIQVALLPQEIRARIISNEQFILRFRIKTLQRLSLFRSNFNFDTFWQAVSKSLRYGAAKTHSLEGKRIHLRRRNNHIQVSGSLGVRFSDELFPILNSGGREQAERINKFLYSLDLLPTEAEQHRQACETARSPSALVEALEAARDNSVIIGYHKIAKALKEQTAMPMSLFQPPRSDRLSHHLRLSKGEKTVADRAGDAWSLLQARVGPQHAFKRLSGLPVNLCQYIEKHQPNDINLDDIISSAITSVSLVHVISICQKLKIRDEVKNNLLDRFLESIEYQGSLFRVLLNWTEKCFYSDEQWWSQSTGDRLALVWTHANRLMDLIVGHGLRMDAAIKAFSENSPNHAIGAALRRSRDYSGDCANPEIIFPETILYHGLGAIFDDQDVEQHFPKHLQPALARLLLTLEGETLKPTNNILISTQDAADSMGSFLRQRPVGLLDEKLDPSVERASSLDAAFAELDLEPSAPDPWTRLAALGRPSIDEPCQKKLDAAFDQASLIRAADLAQNFKVCRLIIDTRRRLGGPIEDAALLDKIHKLALYWSHSYPGPFILGANATPQQEAFTELTEVMATFARDETVEGTWERFGRVLPVVANGWPAVVPSLRIICDSLLRQAPLRQSRALWRSFVILRSWT